MYRINLQAFVASLFRDSGPRHVVSRRPSMRQRTLLVDLRCCVTGFCRSSLPSRCYWIAQLAAIDAQSSAACLCAAVVPIAGAVGYRLALHTPLPMPKFVRWMQQCVRPSLFERRATDHNFRMGYPERNSRTWRISTPLSDPFGAGTLGRQAVLYCGIVQQQVIRWTCWPQAIRSASIFLHGSVVSLVGTDVLDTYAICMSQTMHLHLRSLTTCLNSSPLSRQGGVISGCTHNLGTSPLNWLIARTASRYPGRVG